MAEKPGPPDRIASIEKAVATIIADVLYFEGYAPLKVASGCRRLTDEIKKQSQGWQQLVAITPARKRAEEMERALKYMVRRYRGQVQNDGGYGSALGVADTALKSEGSA